MSNRPAMVLNAIPLPETVEQSPQEMFERYGQSRTFELGKQVFSRGSRGESMFMIVTGHIELLFKGGKEPKRLVPGEVFGELAFLIGDHERSATAVAVTPTRLLELNQESFDELSRAMPDVMFGLLRNTCRYLLTSESNLIEGLEERRRELELAMDYLRRTREELGLTATPTDTDPLTGLYSQRSLLDQLDATLAQAQGGALLLLRLDGVGEVNSALGHDYGDMVLNHFAATLQEGAGMHAFPSRVEGSLFALLLHGVGEQQARDQAEKLLGLLGERRLDLPDLELRLCATLVGDALQAGEGGEALFERLLARIDTQEPSCREGPRFCWGEACA